MANKIQYFDTLKNTELTSDQIRAVKAGQLIGNSLDVADFRCGYRVKEQDKKLGGAELKGSRYNVQEDRMVLNESLEKFEELTSKSEREAVIMQAFADTQRQISTTLGIFAKKQGSTAIMSIVQGNKIYTASLGDSVSYKVCRNKKTGEIISCKRLNRILHNPTTEEEKKRIEKNKGAIYQGKLWAETGNGQVTNLSVSRAFGDGNYETTGLSHEPDIYEDTIDENPDIETFMINSCDGLIEPIEQTKVQAILKASDYDNFEEQDEKYIAYLCKQSVELKEKRPDFSLIAQEFAFTALKQGSSDNISVIIDKLDPKNKQARFKAIYDGHGGSKVSAALAAEEETGLLHNMKRAIAHQLTDKKTQQSSVRISPQQEKLSKEFAFYKQQHELVKNGKAMAGIAEHLPAAFNHLLKEAIKAKHANLESEINKYLAENPALGIKDKLWEKLEEIQAEAIKADNETTLYHRSYCLL